MNLIIIGSFHIILTAGIPHFVKPVSPVTRMAEKGAEMYSPV